MDYQANFIKEQLDNGLPISVNKGNMFSSKTKKTRSRTGCQRCKKMKKKCDERKPHCSYCISRGIQDQCSYSVLMKMKPLSNKGNSVSKNIKEQQPVSPAAMLETPFNHQDGEIKTSLPNLELFELADQSVEQDVQNNPILKANIADMISHDIFLSASGSPFELTASKTSNPLQQLFKKEEHEALDKEEEEAQIIEINLNPSLTKQSNSSSRYSNKALQALKHFELMPTPVPIISQAKTYQSFLPFNISFKNQKILNFYETFTSSFLTPGFHVNEHTLSPFKQYIPKFVNADKDLMKLILFFAKTHMGQLHIDYTSPYMLDDSDIFDDPGSFINTIDSNETNNNQNFLSLSDISFLTRIASQNASDVDQEDLGTYTLKQMVLISLHTFFPGISPVNWRKCMENAKTGILNTSETNEMFSFLNHWVCYQELMSSLTTSNLKLISGNNFEYQFVDDHLQTSTKQELSESSLAIDKFSGMDRQVLKFLNKGVKLLQRFNTDDVNYKTAVQLETMELLIEMEKYMIVAELERDELIIHDMHLRTTNKIFGKITLYLLKRRILNIQLVNSVKIRESLIEIVDLIEQLPFNTAYSSCVFFAMFISGCDLIIFDELIQKRPILLNHLESLHKNVGMESCQRVINYMLQCWLTKKPWWEVFIDNEIDIIFTI